MDRNILPSAAHSPSSGSPLSCRAPASRSQAMITSASLLVPNHVCDFAHERRSSLNESLAPSAIRPDRIGSQVQIHNRLRPNFSFLLYTTPNPGAISGYPLDQTQALSPRALRPAELRTRSGRPGLVAIRAGDNAP